MGELIKAAVAGNETDLVQELNEIGKVGGATMKSLNLIKFRLIYQSTKEFLKILERSFPKYFLLRHKNGCLIKNSNEFNLTNLPNAIANSPN